MADAGDALALESIASIAACEIQICGEVAMKLTARWILGWCFLALGSMALGDVVTLKDGTMVEGEVHRSGDMYIVKNPAGIVTNVPAEKIASIDVRPQGGADASMSRLQSLRRAAENIPDIKQILERYRTFIDQNANTPAATAAAADMKLWEDRVDQGLVKVGDRWITPSERDALRAKSTDVAIALHDMMKQGRFKEAGAILSRSLLIDPQNASLLYLHGVMQYQDEQIPPARKTFEAVAIAAPDHAPTLNNLAVILWRQNAHTAALAYYDRSMLAAPGRPEILDNIAEALNALPREQRDSLVVKKLLRHYNEQEDAMEKKMAELGQYRWGSSWVNEKDLKKLQDAEKAGQDQLNQMTQDFNSVQRRIDEIDSQLRQINNEMNLLDAQTYVPGPNGAVQRIPYPPAYILLSQQAAVLRAERAQRQADVDRLRAAAKQVKAQMPQPKFTGIQKLIDADGMPLPAGFRFPSPPAPAQPPATQPATQPTTEPAAGK